MGNINSRSVLNFNPSAVELERKTIRISLDALDSFESTTKETYKPYVRIIQCADGYKLVNSSSEDHDLIMVTSGFPNGMKKRLTICCWNMRCMYDIVLLPCVNTKYSVIIDCNHAYRPMTIVAHHIDEIANLGGKMVKIISRSIDKLHMQCGEFDIAAETVTDLRSPYDLNAMTKINKALRDIEQKHANNQN